eukprot:scaffold911_cov125-Skeletonema_dohrnii-CCMP3373.AAC.5
MPRALTWNLERTLPLPVIGWRSGKSEKGAHKHPDNQRLPIDVRRRISTMMIISVVFVDSLHH